MSSGIINVLGPLGPRHDEVLTTEALAFVASLHQRFNPERLARLAARSARQDLIDAGQLPGFLPETEGVRSGNWHVSPVPADLQDRRVEITGPVDRKMIINALNSGAKVFMADFEDANSPTWANIVEGQVNLIDAVRRTIRLEQADKVYELGPDPATLMVRPRGWHLVEHHITVDGEPISASLLDFGLYLFHNARYLLDNGSGPYFYLPKLESHLEARLWNDVFVAAQEELDIPVGSIKATVLIETILAAFEMDEILNELQEHSAGLNAGRWDYIFSVIKKLRNYPDHLLPDRALVTMNVHFMRSYTRLLIRTCHRRGAHAMGGMAAFIPSRRDEEVNARAIAKVREDKELEAFNGHDGTWVAHPDLVPIAMEVFDGALGDHPNQINVQHDDVPVEAADLLNTYVEGGAVTEAGLRLNVNVGIRYLEAWLGGNGAAAIFNLMEDAATAEISRSQIWQWIHHGAVLADERVVTRDLVQAITDEELASIRDELGEETYRAGRWVEARQLFEQVALAEEFEEFLTIPAYHVLEGTE
ncbi:MAG: malate synthase A [Acidimicrobiia bacterium]|nr:malate synthase A [Acidimicrobiia bacterium]